MTEVDAMTTPTVPTSCPPWCASHRRTPDALVHVADVVHWAGSDGEAFALLMSSYESDGVVDPPTFSLAEGRDGSGRIDPERVDLVDDDIDDSMVLDLDRVSIQDAVRLIAGLEALFDKRAAAALWPTSGREA